MATTVSEVLWLPWLLKDLGVHANRPMSLFCDNQDACHISNNIVYHERTKHVEMDCYFVHERVMSKEILPLCIHTTHQVADLFTKASGAPRLRFVTYTLHLEGE